MEGRRPSCVFLVSKSLQCPLLTTSWHLLWRKLFYLLKLRVTNVSVFSTLYFFLFFFLSLFSLPRLHAGTQGHTHNFIYVWQLHLADTNGQKLLMRRYRYRHNECEGCFTAFMVSKHWEQLLSLVVIVYLSVFLRCYLDSRELFCLCVYTEAHLHGQRQPVSSWMYLVTHIFALSKSLGGKESSEVQREGGKS